MQFALLIFESPEAFAARNNDETDPYLGAWRAYYKALVEAGIYSVAIHCKRRRLGPRCVLKDGKRHVQDGPFADTKEQLGGFTILSSPRSTRRLSGQRAARLPQSVLWRSVQFHLNTSAGSRDEWKLTRSVGARQEWSGEAPARDLFELPEWGRIAEGLSKAKLVYFSGITLSLYSNTGIGRFLAAIETIRQQGVKIAFDGNFRPRRWRGNLQRTRTVFMEALKRVDIALPAYDDEAVLWGDPSPEATVDRLQAFGIGEIVVKNGPNSALLAAGTQREFIPVPEVVTPVDPTAAGDGFNAAYIAARLSGSAPFEAVAAAHRLAGQVIRHRGADAPRRRGGALERDDFSLNCHPALCLCLSMIFVRKPVFTFRDHALELRAKAALSQATRGPSPREARAIILQSAAS